jgi:hypothetical protein
MRMTFSSEKVAQAAAAILERYGYTAESVGPVVMTDCPILLAVPVVGRAIGLHQVENVHLSDAPMPLANPPRVSVAA